MSNLLQTMNERQIEAITTTQGPLLVMAGAGSGKTRVLTHRIAYLIQEKGVQPWRVLAITFTNKAAKEMKERLEHLVGTLFQDMWVSTFHAMCVKILRREAQHIGYTRSFTIVDSAEQKTLIKQILKSKNLDDKKFNDKVIAAFISDAKNMMLLPSDAKKQANDWFSGILAECYEAYQEKLFKNQAFDFDDLIMKTVELFRNHPEVLADYQQKFQYIHVDEYQDTNKAQYELVLMLSKMHQNLCVVGDADQSIYGWRGADMHNILNFSNDFPHAKTVLLEQNYRSTQTILNAANDVIANNTQRIAKKLWTQNDVGAKIARYQAFSETDEASFVAQEIQKYTNPTGCYNNCAILYRANAQSRVIEEALMRHKIPYRIVGGLRFYDRAEIKDVLAYLRIIANPDDDLSFERVVNVPKRSVGKTSLEKLRSFALEHGISLFKAAQNVMAVGLPNKATKGVSEFVALVTQMQAYCDGSMKEMVTTLLEKSGYEEMLRQEGTLEAESRLENIQEFQSVAATFDDQESETSEDVPKLIEFLTDFALDNPRDEEDNEQAVTLMTLHAAKGLEFPVVFLVGLEESIFPSSRSVFESDDEEERRLMYVGITRAKQQLFLTNATSRLLYGQVQRNMPSRFLDEISETWLEQVGSAYRYGGSSKMGVPTTPQQKNQRINTILPKRPITTKSAGNWKVGDKVSHGKFGIGTIVRIKGSGDDCVLDIAFNEIGIKPLMASFAPITKV
ncbi:DNA helicase PcrA [Carnobacteriaceae bacterium zg-ZUI252]|nr:DNA helicase PcrA [Carnobacteriaceae bacterium zg-ZUI252]